MHARGEAEASPRAIFRHLLRLEPLRRVDREYHSTVRERARIILASTRLDLACLLLAVTDGLELPRRKPEPLGHHVANRLGPAAGKPQVVRGRPRRIGEALDGD